MNISRQNLDRHFDNPFKPINDPTARKFERYPGAPKGWMDEQHVEHDPLCLSSPWDIRELMSLFFPLDRKGRVVVMETVRTLATQFERTDQM